MVVRSRDVGSCRLVRDEFTDINGEEGSGLKLRAFIQ